MKYRDIIIVVLILISLSAFGINSSSALDHPSGNDVSKDSSPINQVTHPKEVKFSSQQYFRSAGSASAGSAEQITETNQANPTSSTVYYSKAIGTVAHTYYSNGTVISFNLQTNGYQKACLVVNNNTVLNLGSVTSSSDQNAYYNTTIHSNMSWYIVQEVQRYVLGEMRDYQYTSSSDEIYSESAPKVEIESSSHYFLIGQLVHFEAITSGSGIISIYWKLDGNIYAQNSYYFNTSFPDAGTFNVTVCVVDQVGLTNQSSFNLYVDSLSLSVSSSLNPDYLNLDREIQFSSSINSSGPFSSNESFSFQYDLCGPNSSSILLQGNYELFGYTFSEPGVYVVKIIAQDQHGLSASGKLVENVNPGGPPITVSVNNPKAYPVNSTLELQASASSNFQPSSYSYEWRIGGRTYSGQEIIISLTRTGNLTLYLNVTDNLGGKGSYHSFLDVVYPGHYAGIKIMATNSSSGPFLSYQIQVESSSGIQSVLYIISGQPQVASLDNISYHGGFAYANYTILISFSSYLPGSYTVNIVAFNNNTDSNQASYSFNVNSSVGQQSFSIISLFGGTFNFLIFMLTSGGLLIAYLTYERSENPTVVIQAGNRRIDMKGKKVK